MNFADRMAMECMMNKTMYTKYLDAQKNTQTTTFQVQKEQYQTQILAIVHRLLTVSTLDVSDAETSNSSTLSVDKVIETDTEIILHPKVIHLFDEFVRNCIESIQDFESPVKNSESDGSPIFFEDDYEKRQYEKKQYDNDT